MKSKLYKKYLKNPTSNNRLKFTQYSVTFTAFHYHTLHIQPIPIAGMARLYAVLCWTISDCSAKQFKVRLCIRPCAPVLLLILFSSGQTIGTFEESSVYCQSDESYRI